MSELESLVGASRDAGFHYRALQRRVLLADRAGMVRSRTEAILRAQQAGLLRPPTG